MKKKIFPIVMGALSALLIAVTVVGNVLAFGVFDGFLTSYFGVTGAAVDNFDTNQYYARELKSAEEASNRSAELCENVEAEGAVLLKNNNLLPLSQGNKVSLFSQSSNDMIVGSTGGSGAINAGDLTLTSALTDVGLVPNPTLVNFYKSKNHKRRNGGLAQGTSQNPFVWKLNEVPVRDFTNTVKDSYTSFADAAIVVLSRAGCENGDLPQDMNDSDGRTRGTAHILELDQNEKDLLHHVTTNFENTIVLLNTANTMECGFLDDYDIDACLWVGGVGPYGLNAVADIIVGNVNPSGRLADTMAYDVLSSPAMQNMGNFAFTINGNETKHHYVTYAEGIYVGYKYYETRYEDKILNRANVGDYDYDTTVQFPFGYGQSYTSFEWGNFKYSLDEAKENITVSVDVKNTGSKKGKEVVQFYYQSPYTNYDVEKGIEKSSISLADFTKTKELEPNETTTAEVTFPVERMKSYDAKGHKTYILEESEKYFIAAGRNAHDALNNIISKKTDNSLIGNASFVKQESFKERLYDKDTTTDTSITNQFDDADGNKKYLTRNNWMMMDNYGLRDGINPSSRYDSDGYIYQIEVDAAFIKELETMGYIAAKSPETNFEEPTFGARNGKKLIDMRGKDFNDPEWQTLLDQIKVQEMVAIVTISGYKTYALESVGKPYATDSDGTSAWRSFIGDGVNAGGMPNETVQASTWNKELVYEIGKIMGELALWSKIIAKDKNPNLTGWYAPAMNIHRTPFGGRNFEYYSEDGMLSGLIGSSVVKGATDKGLITYIKHFAFNEQETNRMTNNVTWAQEQALREIYLTPFEMSVKDGGSRGIMTSYNRVGTVWAGGSYNLITNILRKEWGFNGFVITDYMDGDWENIDQMLAAGGDASLCTSDNPLTTTGAQAHAYFRRTAHHLCYAFVNSNGMNGIDSNTIVSGGTPIYYRYMTAIDIVLGMGISLTLGLLLYHLIKKMLLKKKYLDDLNDAILKEELKLPLIPKIVIGTLVGVITLSTGLWLILTNPKQAEAKEEDINEYIANIDENEDLEAKYGKPNKKELSQGYEVKDNGVIMTFDDQARGYYYEAEYAELSVKAKVSNNRVASNQQFVSYFQPGETMTYTINSAVETDVLVILSLGNYFDRSEPIGNVIYATYGKEELNNEILFGDRVFQGTGNYTKFEENIVGQVHLFEGENKIKFTAYKSSFGDVNYDYMALVKPGQSLPKEEIDDLPFLQQKYGSPNKNKLSNGASMNFDINKRGYYYEAESDKVKRSSAIKIEDNASASGGKNIKNFNPGESITYNINSTIEGDVLIILSGATYHKSNLLIEDSLLVYFGVDENNLSLMKKNGLYINTPGGGWNKFGESFVGEINLKKGKNIIEFVSNEPINIDYICLANPYSGEEIEEPTTDPVDIVKKYGEPTKGNLLAGTNSLLTSTRGAYYEIENAALNGDNIRIEEDNVASGGKYISHFNANYSFEFRINVDKSTDALIIISGACWDISDYLVSDLLLVTCNNQEVKSYDRTYRPLGNSWTRFSEFTIGEAHLQQGENVIKFTSKQAINYDYMGLCLPFSNSEPDLNEKYGTFNKSDLILGTDIFDKNNRGYYYEAENFALTGDARVSDVSVASGRKVISHFQNNSTMTFVVETQEDITALLFASTSMYRSEIKINQAFTIQYGLNNEQLIDTIYTAERVLPTQSNWDLYIEHNIGEIHLKKGKNYIKFTAIQAINFDYIGLVNSK